MEKKNKISLAIFVLVVVALFLIIVLNANYLRIALGNYIKIYGYPAVLIFSFLADFIDQPIGPDAISVTALLFGLNWLAILILAILGTWLANSVNFYIGRKYLAPRIANLCSLKYKSYCKFYNSYGNWALLLSALFFPYIILTWLSGAFGMKYKTFFFYGVLVRAVRIAIVLLVAVKII